VHVVPQVPLSQTWPLPHAMPQAPQLRLLVAVYVQLPLHTLAPAGQVHALFTHVAPCAQVFPQDPQALVSVCVLRHVAPHAVVPGPQAHTPAEQTCPVSHGLPQPPQFRVSVWRFVQAPRQTDPVEHAQVPPWQV